MGLDAADWFSVDRLVILTRDNVKRGTQSHALSGIIGLNGGGNLLWIGAGTNPGID
jgi:hypothetical protein